MKRKPLVSIIILNYNGKNHLDNCLATLNKENYPAKEIIVFDNGSSDGSGDLVKRKYPHVKLFLSKTDLGFCGGNNLAYTKSHGKYVLLLNNDTVVTKNFLYPLVEALEKNTQIGIVQPKIVFLLSKRLQSGAAFFTQTGFLYYFGYGQNPSLAKYNLPIRMYSANGSCMLIRRSVIDKVGLFDESFFSYFEETDFCHRAQLAGYEIYYEPRGMIFHIGSVDNKQHKRAEIQYNSFRNKITSYLKNLEIRTILTVLPIHFSFIFVSFLTYLLLGKPDVSLAIANALFYNLRSLPNILTKRRTIQTKMRSLKDKEFLPHVTKNPRWDYYLRLLNGLKGYRD